MLDAALEGIAEAAAAAPSLGEYRRRVLAILAPAVPHDAALIHALSPRVPLATAALVGLSPEVVAASMPSWDELADVLSPLRERANRELVASDLVLSRRGPARRRLEAAVLRPFGQRSLAIAHLVVRGGVVGAVVLLARRPEAFGARALAGLRRLAPAIAIGDALHQRLDGVPLATLPTRLSCRDQRLTPRQRDIVERVALGHTNDQIAAALGLRATSVRNHLVRIFAAVGASNRADLVRLAVLLPDPGAPARPPRS